MASAAAVRVRIVRSPRPIDLNAPQLAPLLGLGGHDVRLALAGTMTALTLYDLYLVRMQGPEHPRLPVELL